MSENAIQKSNRLRKGRPRAQRLQDTWLYSLQHAAAIHGLIQKNLELFTRRDLKNIVKPNTWSKSIKPSLEAANIIGCPRQHGGQVHCLFRSDQLYERLRQHLLKTLKRRHDDTVRSSLTERQNRRTDDLIDQLQTDSKFLLLIVKFVDERLPPNKPLASFHEIIVDILSTMAEVWDDERRRQACKEQYGKRICRAFQVAHATRV